MKSLPFGATVTKEGVFFRIFASPAQKVEVLLENGKRYPLKAEKNGYYSGMVKDAKAGSLYQYVLDDQEPLPDPISRFQPLGPKGPSQVIDPNLFKWNDGNWKGIVDKEKVVLYELHIGTFTQEGTWRSATEKLPYLVELGITVIEMMPVAECPGRFNWGYDCVDLYAPSSNYGKPDDLRAFINEAHCLGLGVILDIVYNHLGPDGNFLSRYLDTFFKKQETEWGQAINFDDEGCELVREFFIENAGYWIQEFHFDGLRIDACHSISDKSERHILLEVTEKVREKGGRKRTYVIAENESQDVKLILPNKKGGYGLDAVWHEDFHHSAFVLLTGRKEGYFHDYSGHPQEFISALKCNFLYQGQWYAWQTQRRGTVALGMEHCQFINFIENHDQVANTGSAERMAVLSNIRVLRAMTTLLLLSPQIPLLFQGQEFCSTAPFYYFCEHEPELAEKVYNGRVKFLMQMKSLNLPSVKETFPPPHDEKTFKASKLKWEDLETNRNLFFLHKDLLRLRKEDPVFSQMPRVQVDGAVLNDNCFLIRFISEFGDRLLIINFGTDSILSPPAEPLLAPPQNMYWKTYFSSEEVRYGGFGFIEIPREGDWEISGRSAYLLKGQEW